MLRDIDWKTLVFLGGIFCLVQAVTKTGLLQTLTLQSLRGGSAASCTWSRWV